MYVFIYIYVYIHIDINIYIYMYTYYIYVYTYILHLRIIFRCIIYMYMFASDTAHILFIHITSVVKSVHIFMVRNKVSKSCLMVELCLHRFVHFDWAPIYIFGFHQQQCASLQKNFTFVKFTSELFRSADDLLKDEMCLLLL